MARRKPKPRHQRPSKRREPHVSLECTLICGDDAAVTEMAASMGTTVPEARAALAELVAKGFLTEIPAAERYTGFEGRSPVYRLSLPGDPAFGLRLGGVPVRKIFEGGA